ncbi:iron ABC transporter permease [Hyphobacterium sp. HN65]|uniref:Iron ABC transporter permease n=1 Tax=Hyphobacterium lacteum TaxID=3116575 RepID=A0ABU7LPJ6_9PROT|nr:iron ABC transporter permease [Hyphobacterium sp. HN65]MEE2525827.1 iron ABC transporter permease [Hyphobacterium sp. HN65]
MTDVRLITGLVLALLGAFAVGLFAGGFPILDGLDGEPSAWLILMELRLPRLLLGLIVGAALGLSGAALQGYFRNPLADPGVIGVSSSAGLGAVAALYFGLSALSALALPVLAILCAALGGGLLLLVSGRGASATMLILSGVAVGALANALVALAMNFSSNPWALSEIAYWLMGSLRNTSWTEVQLAAPLVALGGVILMTTARDLDALSLGEEAARAVGVNLRSVQIRLVLGTALAVGAAVSIAGAIGFVGLVVPHLLRPLVDHQPSRLLVPSALGGGVLLILADAGTRLISGDGTPLYLGVMTALLGVPFFFHLIRRMGRVSP